MELVLKVYFFIIIVIRVFTSGTYEKTNVRTLLHGYLI